MKAYIAAWCCRQPPELLQSALIRALLAKSAFRYSMSRVATSTRAGLSTLQLPIALKESTSRRSRWTRLRTSPLTDGDSEPENDEHPTTEEAMAAPRWDMRW